MAASIKWNDLMDLCFIHLLIAIPVFQISSACSLFVKQNFTPILSKGEIKSTNLNECVDSCLVNKCNLFTFMKSACFMYNGNIPSGLQDNDVVEGYADFEYLHQLNKYADLTSWLPIQRRINGAINFTRPWIEYKNGFGDMTGEFWIGNDNLHLMSRSFTLKIRFDLWDRDNNYKYAEYSSFFVDSELKSYRISISGYSGTAGDSMKHHDGCKFSTLDRDNDDSAKAHCARKFGGGWWFNYCIDTFLNGQYLTPGTYNENGITWDAWKEYMTLRTVVISVKIK